MRRTPLLLPAVLAVLAANTATAQAPTGYVTWLDKETGLTAHVPKNYRQIPQPPTETVTRARLLAKTSPAQLARMKARPSLYVFLFEWSEGAGVTPGKSATDTEEKVEVPTSIREMMERAKEVRSFEEFKKKKLGRLQAVPYKDAEGIYQLLPNNSQKLSDHTFCGWLVMKRQGPVAYGVYSLTWGAHHKAMRSITARVARSLKLPEGRRLETAKSDVERKLDRLYRGKSYRHIPHRRTIRKGLARGWRAKDTENYIIVYNARNEQLISRVTKNIEAIRAYYEELFPPSRPVTEVSVVRICRNQGEYMSYGGPRGTGGFWHPGNEELVLYDYRQTTLDADRQGKRLKRKTNDKDSLLVLYHEAFHQYVYYAAGEVAPHDWFNEGHGDFFSGASISSGGKRVTRVRPCWWRIHRAKDQMELGKGRVGLENLLTADRKTFYGKRRSDYYAAGWSFVYFMRTSPVVAKNPRWNGLLDLYFETLKTSYNESLLSIRTERADVGEELAPATLEIKRTAQGEARDEAIAKMMDELDVGALESQWTKFIKKMRDPWPNRRARRDP